MILVFFCFVLFWFSLFRPIQWKLIFFHGRHDIPSWGMSCLPWGDMTLAAKHWCEPLLIWCHLIWIGSCNVSGPLTMPAPPCLPPDEHGTTCLPFWSTADDVSQCALETRGRKGLLLECGHVVMMKVKRIRGVGSLQQTRAEMRMLLLFVTNPNAEITNLCETNNRTNWCVESYGKRSQEYRSLCGSITVILWQLFEWAWWNWNNNKTRAKNICFCNGPLDRESKENVLSSNKTTQ